MADVLQAVPELLMAPLESWVWAAGAYYGLALVRWGLVMWAVR